MAPSTAASKRESPGRMLSEPTGAVAGALNGWTQERYHRNRVRCQDALVDGHENAVGSTRAFILVSGPLGVHPFNGEQDHVQPSGRLQTEHAQALAREKLDPEASIARGTCFAEDATGQRAGPPEQRRSECDVKPM